MALRVRRTKVRSIVWNVSWTIPRHKPKNANNARISCPFGTGSSQWGSTAEHAMKKFPNHSARIPLGRSPAPSWFRRWANTAAQRNPQSPHNTTPADAHRWPVGLRAGESRLDSVMYRQSYSEGYRRAAIHMPTQNASTPRDSVARRARRMNSAVDLVTICPVGTAFGFLGTENRELSYPVCPSTPPMYSTGVHSGPPHASEC